ncbi:MAG: class II aldolase/adducin family protein [Anaerolineales bacterium]
MSPSIAEEVASVGRRMFERRLTDIAGGNISGFDGTQIYITPRYSGAEWHWQLEPGDILVASLDDERILSDPKFSREAKIHVAIYRAFPKARAVIHAHPFHVLPFCAWSKPIDPVLESTRKFGRIEVIPRSPAHSAQLAENVVAGLKGKEALIEKQAAAVLIPEHGIVVAGKGLRPALDALERIDWNAWCILARQFLT